MKDTYNSGMDHNQISLLVKVGITGTAYTTVYSTKDGQQMIKIAESDENNGNIRSMVIGNAAGLRNQYIVIRTIIDLSNIDPSLWLNQQQNLVISYCFDGGFSGSQIFKQDQDDINASPSGKNIIVTKSIEIL